jgi:hypothetical protein
MIRITVEGDITGWLLLYAALWSLPAKEVWGRLKPTPSLSGPWVAAAAWQAAP